MYQKTITYTDYNGVERTENFYFNLNRSELIDLMTEFDGDLADYLTQIMGSKDVKALIKFFKMFILRSYGEKSADGKRFVKSQEISDGFAQTEAYSQFFMSLFEDETGDKVSEFIMGIVPSDMKDDIQKALAENKQVVELVSGK